MWDWLTVPQNFKTVNELLCCLCFVHVSFCTLFHYFEADESLEIQDQIVVWIAVNINPSIVATMDKEQNNVYTPPRGRPSSLILNSISSVSLEKRRCSRMAHTSTALRSTSHASKSAFIRSIFNVFLTTEKMSFLIALISFFVSSTGVSSDF